MSAGAVRPSLVIASAFVLLAVAVTLTFSAGMIYAGGTGHTVGTRIYDTRALRAAVPLAPGMSSAPLNKAGVLDMVLTMSLPTFQGSVAELKPTDGSNHLVMIIPDQRLAATAETALAMHATVAVTVSPYATPPHIPGVIFPPGYTACKLVSLIILT